MYSVSNGGFFTIFRYLSKYKKVRTKDGGKWGTATMLKYIEELVAMLGV